MVELISFLSFCLTGTAFHLTVHIGLKIYLFISKHYICVDWSIMLLQNCSCHCTLNNWIILLLYYLYYSSTSYHVIIYILLLIILEYILFSYLSSFNSIHIHSDSSTWMAMMAPSMPRLCSDPNSFGTLFHYPSFSLI